MFVIMCATYKEGLLMGDIQLIRGVKDEEAARKFCINENSKINTNNNIIQCYKYQYVPIVSDEEDIDDVLSNPDYFRY